MFCKFCGHQIDDNAVFCSSCGAKQNDNEVVMNPTPTVEPNVEPNVEPTVYPTAYPTESYPVENVAQPQAKKAVSDKLANILSKCCFGAIVTGLAGATMFLSIVLVGVLVYGEVYLYSGYDFTKVLSTISIVLMIIGLIGVAAKCVLSLVFKIGTFPTETIKRVIIIAVAVACLGFSIWGFADCSANKDDDYSGGGSTYLSFYEVYSSCSCSYPWAEVGADYLEIDSNPYNYDSDSSSSTTYITKACNAIRSINTKLGLPSYLYNEMLETRALDGRQTYTGSKYTVSWRYHPDSGLEVRYTRS